MLQNLAFGPGGRQIDAAATFFRYESGTANGADEGIRVRADGSDLGVYYPGDGIELPVQAGRWEIVPLSAATTGVVRLGVGRVTSARTVGAVRVIDDSRTRTIGNLAFAVSGASGGPADGTAHVVLVNPLGSGRRLNIGQIGIYASASAGNVLASVHMGQVAGFAGQTFQRVASSKLQRNLTSPVPSVASLYTLAAATALPGLAHVEYLTFIGASVSQNVNLHEPFVIGPGTCVVLRASPMSAGAAPSLTGWFEFTEEADM